MPNNAIVPPCFADGRGLSQGATYDLSAQDAPMPTLESEGCINAVGAPRPTKNSSGISPVEYKCLILPEIVEEVTAGGIVLAQSTVDAEQIAEVRARLVSIGGMAFDDWKDQRKPQCGDLVMVAKYSGVTCKGNDKKEYRLVNDKDILAILE